jgi:folate-binding protein YgfZ
VSGLDAAEGSCAIADRSDLGRLVATGPDLLSLLHRLSTGDVKDLRAGEGRQTVVTDAKGRIVERLFVHHLGGDGVLLVAGPGGAPRVQAHLQRFTFAEKTGLSDVTATTFALALLGPRWAAAASAAGIPELAPYGSSAVTLAGMRVHAARTNGFNDEGVLVLGPRDCAEPIRDALGVAAASEGGGMIEAEALEAWRILRGLPAPGHELTGEHNPLEAGLRDAVSFSKGCYVGQEVVARLNTYGKVSRALVRLRLEPGAPVPAPGAAIRNERGTIGAVTSAILPPGRPAPVALGYVKSRELSPDVDLLTIDDGETPLPATLLRT